MDRSPLIRDPGQASGGYVASSTMVGTGSGLSLPAGAKYSFDLAVIHKANLPTHDDSHGNLGVETLDTTAIHPPDEGDLPLTNLDNPMVYHAPMADYDAPSEPQFMSAPVQASDGSSAAHNLIKLWQQEGVSTSNTGYAALPSGEGMTFLRGQADLSSLIAILQGFGIELAANDLSDLKALLLEGKKVIIMMIQKSGTITVLHIHPAGNNQALIITEVGVQSAPINIDSLAALLNSFAANEEVTLLTLFTHTEVTISLPTAPLPQTQSSSASASVSASTSASASAPDWLTTAILDYIQQSLKFSAPTLLPAVHHGAVQELQDTHDQASLEILMPTYGFHPGPTEGTALKNVEQLSADQTPFIVQLIGQNQQAIAINLQPDSAGDVTLTLSGQHFVIDSRDVGALFDWIINNFAPLVRIFILAALFL
ncbi:hypothetical protein [Endozoicomonas arenosclerae]|uniref:hypothetical protein n=1 Tax=Endozoicomonas arenosclerae TaxID=1633495 RepID=UPI000780E3CF|nr:hypothetical protein [Endozoicomonas arenosclerae]